MCLCISINFGRTLHLFGQKNQFIYQEFENLLLLLHSGKSYSFVKPEFIVFNINDKTRTLWCMLTYTMDYCGCCFSSLFEIKSMVLLHYSSLLSSVWFSILTASACCLRCHKSTKSCKHPVFLHGTYYMT